MESRIIKIDGKRYRRKYFAGNATRCEAITNRSHINPLKDILEITYTTPVANFTTAIDEVDPLKVIFTNTSKYATEYEWDFGDGTPIVTTTSPQHTYTKAGTYTVTLTASDVAADDIKEVKVTVTSE